MKPGLMAIAIGTGMLAMGCSAATELPQPAPQSPAPLQQSPEENLLASTQQAQVLPITATVDIRGTQIDLEVAETPLQRAIGLMFRPEIPNDRGMLFPFSPPRPVQFWMRNVLVPLDMVFLNQGQVVAIAADVPPCTELPCSTYGPSAPVDQVIELRGGRAAELGLQAGDRLRVEPVSE
ncbi:MAG: DUF192 domain-containing protein [Elainellaceae cyanobacterium]